MADVATVLAENRETILRSATDALSRTRARHYEAAGLQEVGQRLGSLFDLLVAGIAARQLTPIVDYAQRIAEERFNAGYDLGEVQTGFNALEEAAWAYALQHLDASEYAEALGLISTVLGAAKDALARRYVSLATNADAGSLDLRALFTGFAA
jgi:hypothetical protein